MTDGTVMHLTWASEPREREWKCPLGDDERRDALQPYCRTHGIPMKPPVEEGRD